MIKNKLVIQVFTGTNTKFLDIGILLLRCTVGLVLFVIGAGKVFGWFGGMGLETTVQNFAKTGISAPLAYVSCFTEFIGGFLLIIGLFTRPASFAVMINMLVAFIVTLPKGFFMGGAYYPFSLMMSSVIILLAGPMLLSLDALILKPGKLINEHHIPVQNSE